MHRTGGLVGFLLCLALVGCGEDRTLSESAAELGSCQQYAARPAVFPVTAIDSPLGAEDLAKPANRALNEYLNSSRARADQTPTKRWRELWATDNAVVFGWEAPSGQTEKEVVVERGSDGVWSANRATGCAARFYQDDRLFADLSVVEATPDAQAVELSAIVRTYDCRVLGQPKVDLEEKSDAVLVNVAFIRDRRNADDFCDEPSSAKKVVLELEKPLGSRKLLDSGYLVPRAIESSAEGTGK